MKDTRKLFSSSAILFVGSIVASIFSYLFNMLSGRLLGPKSYGELTALLSVLAIISVAGGAILTVSMRYSSELFAQDKPRALKKLFLVLSKYTFIIAILIFAIFVAFCKPIASYLSFSNLLPVIIAFASLIFGLAIMVNKGILQGTQRFLAISIVGALEMILRLVLGIALIKLGLAVGGAMLAVISATAVCYFLTLAPISRVINQPAKNQTVEKP